MKLSIIVSLFVLLSFNSNVISIDAAPSNDKTVVSDKLQNAFVDMKKVFVAKKQCSKSYKSCMGKYTAKTYQKSTSCASGETFASSK